ncbi:hypothetical protein D782_0677 [Enterobacteriaceae bacterium strain FGI 57]|jgi:hypothetical protein|nr:hypothetical protein D782_0677 [Enterobacteriaceae bacterium strain FGI 57]
MTPSLCPICLKKTPVHPHDVCRVCFDKFKAEPDNTCEFWKEKIPHPVAIDLAILIIDNAGEREMDRGKKSEMAWHLKRLDFVSDCIDLLPDSLFLPASRQNVKICQNMALNYWHQITATGNLQEIDRYIRTTIDDKNVAEWDAKTLPGLMASDEESLDFMWTQFIESAVACVRTHFSDETWMRLFHKHFSAEIHAWVNQTGDES